MNIKHFLFLAFVGAYPVTANALVLCAAQGEFPGTAQPGAQVVVREVCLGNETALLPVTAGNSTDVSETVAGNKTTTVGVNRTESVGKDETISIVADRTETVGKDESVAIGRNRSITCENDEVHHVGHDRTRIVGANEAVTVGKKYSLNAAGEYFVKSGNASILMKKNGDLTLTGRNISIKGAKVTIKEGGKK